MSVSKDLLTQVFNKHYTTHLRYSIEESVIESRSVSFQALKNTKELAFVPLHPKRIEHNAEALWKQWNLRNSSVAHKKVKRSKLDSVFSRKVATGEISEDEDIDVGVRVYTDLYYALYGIPKNTYVYVGYYLPIHLVNTYDLPKTAFLVDGQFAGVVLLRIE